MAGVDSPDTVVAARELIVAGAVYEISTGMVDFSEEVAVPRPTHPRAQGIGRKASSTSRYLSAMCGRIHRFGAYPCANKEHDESPRHRHAIMVRAAEVAAILFGTLSPSFCELLHFPFSLLPGIVKK